MRAHGTESNIQPESSAAKPDCLPVALNEADSDNGANGPAASTLIGPSVITRASHQPSSAGAKACGMTCCIQSGTSGGCFRSQLPRMGRHGKEAVSLNAGPTARKDLKACARRPAIWEIEK